MNPLAILENPLAILEPMLIMLAAARFFALFWVTVALLSARTEQQAEAEAAHLINRYPPHFTKGQSQVLEPPDPLRRIQR